MRAIVFILFVVLVFLILRFTLNRIIAIREKQKQQAAQAEKQQESRQEGPEEMVRCAQCGVHLPQAEAYFDGKDTFCSEGHMHEFSKKQKADSDNES